MAKGENSFTKGLWPTLIIFEVLFLGAMWWIGDHAVAVKSFLKPLVDYLLPQVAKFANALGMHECGREREISET